MYEIRQKDENITRITRLKYCIYMFFPEVNKGTKVVKRYTLLISVLLMPPEKGKNEQELCWHPVISFAKIHVYYKSFIEPI